MERSHHRPGGGFRNPWPTSFDSNIRFAEFLRWRVNRFRNPLPKSPPANEFPTGVPDIAKPNGRPNELRATWIGQSSLVLQMGRFNVLTDPVWSLRASPFPWIGPTRFVAPAVTLSALPTIHAVVISHDHYDHLDEPTLRTIARLHPEAEWIAPLGHHRLLSKLGGRSVNELDWWSAHTITVDGESLEVTALPAQHWTRRVGSPMFGRLWCGFALESGAGRVFFAGDSGYCPAFTEIGQRMGPFDLSLIPIGAYEPRWFMKSVHMNPEEAVQIYQDLGGSGDFVAMHWGTFRLTDEPPLEPPRRVQQAWATAGLDPARLIVLPLGGTLIRSRTS